MDFLIQKETLTPKIQMKRNYFWKVVIQEEKVALTTSNISYGTNYYSRVITCYDFSTDPPLLYKGLQINIEAQVQHHKILLKHQL